MTKEFEANGFMSPVRVNGGWTHVGDGEGNKTLLLTKDGVTIKLKEDEIEKLLKTLAFFTPKLY